MAGPIYNEIMQSLQTAEGLYYRLVLLVGPSGSGKTDVLRDAAKALGASVINVNLVLSSKLLELTAKQRSLQLQGILESTVRDEERKTNKPNGLSPPVFLDNIEILFDKELKQDPLRLLLGVSRHRTVVASWNGLMRSGKLVYAELAHAEYRSYEAVDALIVKIKREGATW